MCWFNSSKKQEIYLGKMPTKRTKLRKRGNGESLQITMHPSEGKSKKGELSMKSHNCNTLIRKLMGDLEPKLAIKKVLCLYEWGYIHIPTMSHNRLGRTHGYHYLSSNEQENSKCSSLDWKSIVIPRADVNGIFS